MDDLVINAKEKLWDAGFNQYTSCHCNGNYTEKYMLKGTIWKVSILPKKGTFFIKYGGNTLVGKKLTDFNEIFATYLKRIQEEAKTGH